MSIIIEIIKMDYGILIKRFITSIRDSDNETLQEILNMGLDPNHYYNRRNFAEFVAVEINNIEGMDMLLKAGLKLTTFSSLVKIARNSYFAEDKWNGKTMLDVLIENDVNINITNKNRRNILWYFTHEIGAFEFLRRKGVKSHVRDDNNETVYEFMEKNNNLLINEGIKYSS